MASVGEMIVWRLKHTMDRLRVSRYALQKASGISMGTIRGLYDGQPRRTDFPVIEQIIETLRSLTGEPVTLQDVLGWEEAKKQE